MTKTNKNARVCTQCEDTVTGIYPGCSAACEVFLYLITAFSFCIPAIIYSWFRRRKGLKCPNCNQYALVPVDSARAKKILSAATEAAH